MKTIIVCGGSKGIGAVTVKNLLFRNYNVICVSRSEGSLDSGILSHPNFKILLRDLSIPEERRELMGDISKLESVWGLVNNASGPSTGPMLDANRAEYLRAFDTHLFAADDLVKAVIPKMKATGGGRVVNIISVTARVPLENMCVSNTLRGAMLNWSKTLSKELGKFNVTVNNVLPGYTETERLLEVIEGISGKLGITKEAYSEKIIGQIPMGRFGRPEEIGAVVSFLLGEDASFINGASIPVDGGWTPCP